MLLIHFFLVFLTILIFILRYFNKKHRNYFKIQGIPYVNPLFFVGNVGPVILNIRSMAEQMKIIYNSQPQAKYLGFHELTNPIIMIRDLELIKLVSIKNFNSFVNHTASMDENLDPLFAKSLIFNQDDTWRNVRSVLSPTFSSSRLKSAFTTISHTCSIFFRNLSPPNKTVELEMKTTLSRCICNISNDFFFGIQVDTEKNYDNEFYQLSHNALHLSYVNSMKLFVFRIFPWLSKLLKLQAVNSKFTRYFSEAIHVAVKARVSAERNDMLQLMLQAKNQGNPLFQEPKNFIPHAFIFFFGSFDTLSTGTAFTIYEIARNQRVQTKLQAEIDEILGSNGDKVSYDLLQEMKYLNAVVCEGLRKFPPATQADRVCNKATKLPPALPGMKPYVIQPGTVVLIPIYAIQHDPNYFPHPETFHPERFMMEPTNDKQMDNDAYLPFGIGPRFCIAQRFALLVAKLTIFHLLANYSIKPSKKTPSIILRNSLFAMDAKNGLWLEFKSRK